MFYIDKIFINPRADILLLVNILTWTNANSKCSIAMPLVDGGMILLYSSVFNYNR